MTTGITTNESAEITTLIEFITALSTDSDCRVVFVLNEKLNKCFDGFNDGLLDQAFL